MDKVRLEEYHATRDYSDKGFRSSCYAPHVSMYFDTLGNVLACCQNSKYPMGNVTQQRLSEIWHGERSKKLRKALQKDSFGAGCQFCEWQISVGNYVNAFTRNFDGYPVPSPDPEWPQMMEFSVSNTCNLECIMCIGVLSSSIRSRREGLPPLPKAYDEQFFQDLRPFLHHLKFAKFLGGEPFLAAESFRIWDLMHEEGVSFPCNVTTNGTQWNEKVEQVLERFPISICVSMDGATKKTVEGIRVNASFDRVHENFRRFHEYCRRRNTPIVLTYCLMPQNWHEFGDYLLFAEDWGCPVGVNLVYEPPQCSLYTQSVKELSQIARGLEKQSETILPKLKLNRDVWLEQLTAIRRRVENAADSARTPFQTSLSLVVLNKSELQQKIDYKSVDWATSRLREHVGPQATILKWSADKDDRIESIEGSDQCFGLAVAECTGRPFNEIVEKWSSKHGPFHVVPIYISYDFTDRCFLFQLSDGSLFGIHQICVPRLNEFGMTSGSVAVAASFSIAPGSLTYTGDRIRSVLRGWSKDAKIEMIQLDASGKIKEIPAGLESWDGLAGHLRVGMPHAEFLHAAKEAWGPSEHFHGIICPDYEDQIQRFDRKTDLLFLRSFTIPAFDPTGRHIGYSRFTAMTKLDADKMVEVETSVRARLAEWSGSDQVLKLTMNRGNETIAAELPEKLPAGIDQSWFLGKTHEQLYQVFEKNFGNRQCVFYEVHLDNRDIIDTYSGPRGRLMLRYVDIPRFNTAGHHVGVIRLASLVEIGRREALAIEADAMKTLDDWSSGGFILTTVETPAGVIKRAMFQGSSFHGLDVAALVGLSQDKLQRKIIEKHGQHSFRYFVDRARQTDAILDYGKPGSLLLVRGIRFPHVEIDNHCDSSVTLIAGKLFDEQSSAQSEARWLSELKNWDNEAQVLRVFESRDRQVKSIDGPVSILDMNLQEFIGRPFEELAGAVESKVGPRQVTKWEQKADSLDVSVELVGNGLRVSLRFVSLPFVPPGGAEPGSLHLLGIKVLREVNLLEKLEQIAAELKTWAGSDEFMCIVEDEFSRILEVDSAKTHVLNVEIASLPSRGMPTVSAEIERNFGSPLLRRQSKSPGRSDIWAFFKPAGSLISARTVILPTPLHNRTISAIDLVVCKRVTPAEIQKAREDALTKLTSWAGHADIFEFLTVGTEKTVRWNGRSEGWHGITPSDVNGKSLSQVHELIVGKLGPLDFQSIGLSPVWEELRIEFKGEHKDHEARAIVMPFLADSGEHLGDLQLVVLSAEMNKRVASAALAGAM